MRISDCNTYNLAIQKKYCNKEEKYCEKCAKPLNEGKEENNHICSTEYCFYCNKEHKTGDKQKCDEYKKEKKTLNKMTEQKCDIYKARKSWA